MQSMARPDLTGYISIMNFLLSIDFFFMHGSTLGQIAATVGDEDRYPSHAM